MKDKTKNPLELAEDRVSAAELKLTDSKKAHAAALAKGEAAKIARDSQAAAAAQIDAGWLAEDIAAEEKELTSARAALKHLQDEARETARLESKKAIEQEAETVVADFENELAKARAENEKRFSPPVLAVQQKCAEHNAKYGEGLETPFDDCSSALDALTQVLRRRARAEEDRAKEKQDALQRERLAEQKRIHEAEVAEKERTKVHPAYKVETLIGHDVRTFDVPAGTEAQQAAAYARLEQRIDRERTQARRYEGESYFKP